MQGQDRDTHTVTQEKEHQCMAWPTVACQSQNWQHYVTCARALVHRSFASQCAVRE